MRFLVILLLTGCVTQPVSTPPKTIQISQDIESCTIDNDTPWCISACSQSTYSWCIK
jgi:hypothetical protein